MRSWLWTTCAAALAAAAAGAAGAVSLPFTEEFPTSVSGWEDNANFPLDYSPGGGPGGGSHASAVFDYTGFVAPFPGAGPIVMRAQDEDNASGGAFIGNWNTASVTEVRAFVRHDAPVPLSWILRIATSANFPGAAFDPPDTTVEPGVWTEIVFDVTADSPDCIPESFVPTYTCADALATVAHLQLGVDAPQELIDDGVVVTFDVDRVRLLGDEECNNGLDDDGDTHTDHPSDPGCSGGSDLSELGFSQCDDGADNDADSFTDYPDDPHCVSPIDNKEKPGSCGLGFELALLMPLLVSLRRRRAAG
jgi:hypothetical protein